MKEWKVLKISYISEASLISDNAGQVPHQAKYIITFVNIYTGELSYSSDYIQKINKRNKVISTFQHFYTLPYQNHDITIFSTVVSQSKYKSPSKFINTITRKLSRKDIKVLGYVWVRDVGDVNFDLHYHFLIATQKVDAKLFKTLFSVKQKKGYDIQFLRTKTGMARYIKKKELYGTKKQRTYGRSKKFKSLGWVKATIGDSKAL